jgi:hypothetical protein
LENLAVKLVSARAVNCQSHEDTLFEFVPGLNVIVADNNVGKSVFIKMLKAAACPDYYDKDERNNLIRRNCEFASMEYFFTDGSAGMVRVYEKGPLYYFTEDYENDGYTTSLEPDERLITNLGLVVDQEENFIANILDLDQSLLLVSTTSKANGNLVKLLTTNHKLNRMIEITAEKANTYKAKGIKLDELYINLNFKLSSYKYIDTEQLGKSISSCEAAIEVYDKLISAYRELEFIGQLLVSEKDYDFLVSMADFVIEGKHLVEGCKDLFTEEEDLDMLEYLEAYIDLKEAYSHALEIRHIDDSVLYDSAELIAAAYEQAIRIEVDTFGDDVFIAVEVYDQLSRAQYHCKMLYNEIRELEKLDREVLAMETELNKLGRRVPCVIYGEVQHVDGECIPIDNGLSHEGHKHSSTL